MRVKKVSRSLSKPTSALYKAVENYVKSKGGNLVVIGGIQIQQWPGDGEYKFTVGIQCVGHKPKI